MFWVAAPLDSNMATSKIVNQSTFSPQPKTLAYPLKLNCLYCLACEVLSIQLLDGVHFEVQDGGQNSFPFKWKHWFLVSERSDLSQNVYIYNSPKKFERKYIATLTMMNNLFKITSLSTQPRGTPVLSRILSLFEHPSRTRCILPDR